MDGFIANVAHSFVIEAAKVNLLHVGVRNNMHTFFPPDFDPIY